MSDTLTFAEAMSLCRGGWTIEELADVRRLRYTWTNDWPTDQYGKPMQVSRENEWFSYRTVSPPKFGCCCGGYWHDEHVRPRATPEALTPTKGP